LLHREDKRTSALRDLAPWFCQSHLRTKHRTTTTHRDTSTLTREVLRSTIRHRDLCWLDPKRDTRTVTSLPSTMVRRSQAAKSAQGRTQHAKASDRTQANSQTAESPRPTHDHPDSSDDSDSNSDTSRSAHGASLRTNVSDNAQATSGTAKLPRSRPRPQHDYTETSDDSDSNSDACKS
jgi:hypothetical protein